MPVRSLDGDCFDAWIGQPAVVVFVRGRDAAARTLLALIEVLAPVYEPRVGFAMVDLEHCPGLAERFGLGRGPAVLLFDDFRGCGRLDAPSSRTELVHLIETCLST